MPRHDWKDGNRCTITEWAFRKLDDAGDVMDANYFETEAEAVAELEAWTPAPNEPAALVEKVVRRYPAHRFDEPQTYAVVKTKGSADALREGCWIK